MTNLSNQIAEQFNGSINNGDVTFTYGDTDFVFTDGTIYQSIDGVLSAGSKKAKTFKTIERFVALRA